MGFFKNGTPNLNHLKSVQKNTRSTLRGQFLDVLSPMHSNKRIKDGKGGMAVLAVE